MKLFVAIETVSTRQTKSLNERLNDFSNTLKQVKERYIAEKLNNSGQNICGIFIDTE